MSRNGGNVTMKEKDYGVHIMTKEEWENDVKQSSSYAKASMRVEAEMQAYREKRACEIGKIQDEEWMKKL